MVLKFVIAAIVIFGFVGLGGLDTLSAFGQRTKKELLKENGETIIENDDIITNESEAKAIIDDQEIPTTPREKKSDEQTRLIKGDFAPTKSNLARISSDIRKLDTRARNARRPELKKSGAEVVREKERQELLAGAGLRTRGATFGGRGKFGRRKLFGNPNFDLGLPSSATKADRDKVTAQKAVRSGRRTARQLEKKKIDILTKTLSRKSEDELRKIARDKGFKFTGSLTASNLAKVLAKTGGS